MRMSVSGEPGSGAVLAAGLPENGLHDPRSLAAQTNKNGCITPGGGEPASGQGAQQADCVCRGGLCPRREGCKFWVELMRERLQRKKASKGTCTNVELATASAPLVLPGGRGRVSQLFAAPGASAFVLEVRAQASILIRSP